MRTLFPSQWLRCDYMVRYRLGHCAGEEEQHFLYQDAKLFCAPPRESKALLRGLFTIHLWHRAKLFRSLLEEFCQRPLSHGEYGVSEWARGVYRCRPDSLALYSQRKTTTSLVEK